MKELIEKIESYGFCCQAGDLQHCKEWRELTERIISMTAYCAIIWLIDDEEEETGVKKTWEERLKEKKEQNES